MGAEFEVGSLEEMCRLMCDNYIPRRKPHKCGECKHLSSEKCSIGYKCVNPEKKLKWKSPTAMWKYKHTPACRMFEVKEERDQTKLCETCIYRNEDEYHKPCIVYRDDCEFYEKERGDMNISITEDINGQKYVRVEQEPSYNLIKSELSGDAISRQAVIEILTRNRVHFVDMVKVTNELKDLPSVNPQEPKTGWNNHQIACMLADLFGDACACNYNGIDEWLPELCDFKDTCCPNPVGVACWEQFLKYSQSRYTECGYEVRDKGALQEPKTGHWIEHNAKTYECSECHNVKSLYASYKTDYCPDCGARMESEVSDADSN